MVMLDISLDHCLNTPKRHPPNPLGLTVEKESREDPNHAASVPGL